MRRRDAALPRIHETARERGEGPMAIEATVRQKLGSPFKQRAMDFGKRFMAEFKSDDLPGMAAETAYHLIFAIPPILILLVTVAAMLNTFTDIPVVENLRSTVDQRAPADLKTVFDSTIDSAISKANGGAVSIGAAVTFLVALWSASNAVTSLIKGLNRTYDVDEERGLVKKKLLSLGLTALFLVLFNAAFVLFVFGRQLGVWIAGKIGLGTVFSSLWNIGRWPVAVVLVMLFLSLLFYLGPNIDQDWRWVSPGSIFATLVWVIIVFGFKFYLAVSNPGSAYGIFGALVVLLFFLYVTGLIFLLGSEMNAVILKRSDEASKQAALAEAQAENPPSRPTVVTESEPHEAPKLMPLTVSSGAERGPATESSMPVPLLAGGAAAAAGVGGLIGWFVGRRGARDEDRAR
jgi:membrane protein